MRKNMIFMLLAVVFVLGVCACSHPVRAITHQSYWEKPGEAHQYVCYWEGQCGFNGCDKGESLIKLCNINQDNTVQCSMQDSANSLLNPQKK